MGIRCFPRMMNSFSIPPSRSTATLQSSSHVEPVENWERHVYELSIRVLSYGRVRSRRCDVPAGNVHERVSHLLPGEHSVSSSILCQRGTYVRSMILPKLLRKSSSESDCAVVLVVQPFIRVLLFFLVCGDRHIHILRHGTKPKWSMQIKVYGH